MNWIYLAVNRDTPFDPAWMSAPRDLTNQQLGDLLRWFEVNLGLMPAPDRKNALMVRSAASEELRRRRRSKEGA